MTNTRHILFIVITLIILAGAAWWYTQNSGYILPVASGDSVASWDFQGARKDGGTLEDGARKEITRLERMLGGDQTGGEGNPTDYELYVGMANQYEGLGDGAQAREYLEKALAIDSEKTGLAWHNLGALMSRLGAHHTARIAYARAVEAQPHVIGYHLARVQFLKSYFASDTAAVDGAFAESTEQFGDDASILQLQAQWLEETGRTTEAIAALEKMKAVMPPEARAGIDAEIARLRAL